MCELIVGLGDVEVLGVDDEPGEPLRITSVHVPESRLPPATGEADVRRELLERYGIEIGGGLGALAGKCWRIGCMGHTARTRNVTLVLAALDEVLA